MSNNHGRERRYGEYNLSGFLNPAESERPEKLRGAGRLVKFSNQGVDRAGFYLGEKDILQRLLVVERLANQGVYEGRTIQHLFNAVKSGLPVNGTMRSALLKPEDLYMLLDGLYNKEVRPIQPFGSSHAPDMD